MRKFGRVLASLVGTAVGGVAVASLMLTAGGTMVLAETTPPNLPFDPHEFGDGQWIGMPTHTRCDDAGKGSAQLLISLDEDWSGATEIDVNATASNADSATSDTVIWNTSVTVEPGSWVSVSVPVDDRGVRIWVDEEGVSYQGSVSTACQSAPIAPNQDANTITIPEADDLHYFVAPVSVNGQQIEAKWDPANFSGFYVAGTRMDEYSEPVSGEIAVPEGGLQVFVTGLFEAKVQYGWADDVTSSWTFDYNSDPAIPQTPAVPTQDGNSVLIPISSAFDYVTGQGDVLAAGAFELAADVVITAVPRGDVKVAQGAATTWAFTFSSEPEQTRPPSTPPAASGLSAADLTAQTRGHTQAPAEATAGESILVTVGNAFAGQTVRVVLFSTPRELGTFLVAANGTIRVALPGDITAGDHRLAIYDGTSGVLGWDPISIKPSNVSASETDVLSDSFGSRGVNIPVSTVVMAVLLLGAGAVAFVLQRRRDRDPEGEDS